MSNASLARWQAAERALGSRVLSNQVGYSLVNRAAERDLLPFAESHGRLVIAFRPLELGLLSGKYGIASRPADRMRTTHPLFLPENLESVRGRDPGRRQRRATGKQRRRRRHQPRR